MAHGDKADPNTLYDEITVIDHALTRPWIITKKYLRNAGKHPVWRETVCAEDNHHVVTGTGNYFLSAEGYLMPAKKGQPPPDLRYFNKARKSQPPSHALTTQRTCREDPLFVRFWGEADVSGRLALPSSVAHDPNRW
jgi:hypothetical protein